MAEIKSTQTGKRIDKDLKAIIDILTEAEKAENEGKVLYVRRGNSAFEDGFALFDIVPLT